MDASTSMTFCAAVIAHVVLDRDLSCVQNLSRNAVISPSQCSIVIISYRHHQLTLSSTLYTLYQKPVHHRCIPSLIPRSWCHANTNYPGKIVLVLQCFDFTSICTQSKRKYLFYSVRTSVDRHRLIWTEFAIVHEKSRAWPEGTQSCNWLLFWEVPR